MLALAVLPLVEASATSRMNTVLLAIMSLLMKSSLRLELSSTHPRKFSRICSGPCVVAATTSVSSRRSTMKPLYSLPWGGMRIHDTSATPALITAFENAIYNAEKDTKLAHVVSFTTYDTYQLAFTELEYFVPVDLANPPEIAKEYLSIPFMQDNTGNSTLEDLTPHRSNDMSSGFRTSMWSASFKMSAELIQKMTDYFFEIAPDLPAVSVNIAFQAFSKPALEAMQKNGGNALGLYPEDGPFFHVLVYMAWNGTSDDTTMMMKAAEDYIQVSKTMAKELGVDNDYYYMPYSSGYQPVVAGYCAENMARLQAISNKYDPTQVFQNLQPGYFKLHGKAPLGASV